MTIKQRRPHGSVLRVCRGRPGEPHVSAPARLACRHALESKKPESACVPVSFNGCFHHGRVRCSAPRRGMPAQASPAAPAPGPPARG